jgi:hypothetical protein
MALALHAAGLDGARGVITYQPEFGPATAS